MTTLDSMLADLEAKAKAATPGEWAARDFTVAPATEKHAAIHTCKIDPIQRRVLGSLQKPDADYIEAVQPKAILALISAIKSDRERVRREALEEAAQRVASEATGPSGYHNAIAALIRALKDKEPM